MHIHRKTESIFLGYDNSRLEMFKLDGSNGWDFRPDFLLEKPKTRVAQILAVEGLENDAFVHYRQNDGVTQSYLAHVDIGTGKCLTKLELPADMTLNYVHWNPNIKALLGCTSRGLFLWDAYSPPTQVGSSVFFFGFFFVGGALMAVFGSGILNAVDFSTVDCTAYEIFALQRTRQILTVMDIRNWSWHASNILLPGGAHTTQFVDLKLESSDSLSVASVRHMFRYELHGFADPPKPKPVPKPEVEPKPAEANAAT